MSIWVGRRGLENAFIELVGFVDVLLNAQIDLAKAHAPVFTYILSPKQRAQLDRICEQKMRAMEKAPKATGAKKK